MRNELFAEYKAHRDETPKPSVLQFRTSKKSVNIPIMVKEGCQIADDIIGTLAKKAEKQGYQTFMVTDKDFAMVSEYIYVPSIWYYETWGIPEVKKIWSGGPSQVIDLLGMMGDSRQHPRLTGCGRKTAKNSSRTTEVWEKLWKTPTNWKAKWRKKVEKNADLGRLSK